MLGGLGVGLQVDRNGTISRLDAEPLNPMRSGLLTWVRRLCLITTESRHVYAEARLICYQE